MNYYNEIKKELIDNELNKKVKDYSKNKYEIQKYYDEINRRIRLRI